MNQQKLRDEQMSVLRKGRKCNHKPEFIEQVRPMNCGLTLTSCAVCGKELERVYDQ